MVVGYILAAINVFVVPLQALSRRSSIPVVRQAHVLSVQRVVFLSVVELFLDARTDLNRMTRRHGQVATVKKGVKVLPEQDAVRRGVCAA